MSLPRDAPLPEFRQNILVAPYEAAWVGGPDHLSIPTHGRIRTQAGFADEFPDRMRVTNARLQSGRFLYGGPLKIHFGHVVVDSAIRLWAFDRKQHDGVVFAALDKAPLPQWFFDIVALFGVEPSDVVVVYEPTIFERLDFAPPGSILGVGPSAWYLDILRRRMPIEPRYDLPKHIYLGRTHMLAHGTLMGETYFSNKLSASGFQYIRPEEHDIRTQIAMISRAETIVFTEGSSIYSAEFLAQTNANVYMIPRRSGGSALFAPHLLPRVRRFRLLGDQSRLVRFGNRRSINGPNSPSYALNPAGIHWSMVLNRLIRPSLFDKALFEKCEKRDAQDYFVKRERLADEQLAMIRTKRAWTKRWSGSLSKLREHFAP